MIFCYLKYCVTRIHEHHQMNADIIIGASGGGANSFVEDREARSYYSKRLVVS